MAQPLPAQLLDPTAAPEGYRAVLKSDVANARLGNICRACDWRETCQNPDTDFTLPNHRCMSYSVAVRGQEGLTVRRQDGCSVVFKRLAGADARE